MHLDMKNLKKKKKLIESQKENDQWINLLLLINKI